MTAVPHVYPYGALAIAQGQIDLATALAVLLVDVSSNPYVWNSTSQAHRTVADVLSGSGSGALTEVSTTNTSYTRQILTGVSAVVSGLTTEILANPVTWFPATFTAQYAVFFEDAHTTDATKLVVSYWDFTNQIQPVNNGTFSLAPLSGVFLETPVS